MEDIVVFMHLCISLCHFPSPQLPESHPLTSSMSRLCKMSDLKVIIKRLMLIQKPSRNHRGTWTQRCRCNVDVKQLDSHHTHQLYSVGCWCSVPPPGMLFSGASSECRRTTIAIVVMYEQHSVSLRPASPHQP